jgi:hypothetical protein
VAQFVDENHHVKAEYHSENEQNRLQCFHRMQAQPYPLSPTAQGGTSGRK